MSDGLRTPLSSWTRWSRSTVCCAMRCGARPERYAAPESSLRNLASTRCVAKSSGTNYTQSLQRQKCTWVDVRVCELMTETRRGVVPGEPSGGSSIQCGHGSGPRRDPQRQRGVVGRRDGAVRRVVSDVTYVDDLCLMVSADRVNC